LFSHAIFCKRRRYREVSTSNSKKQRLIKEFEILEESFVVLHLAPMTRGRNLDIFKKIQKQDAVQVLIVGRDGAVMDKRLLLELKEAGCLVSVFSHAEKFTIF
jgi:hypothetical protein